MLASTSVYIVLHTIEKKICTPFTKFLAPLEYVSIIGLRKGYERMIINLSLVSTCFTHNDPYNSCNQSQVVLVFD